MKAKVLFIYLFIYLLIYSYCLFFAKFDTSKLNEFSDSQNKILGILETFSTDKDIDT